MLLYLDPTKRHDFVFLFDVTNGNPNGDPDAGNMPRLDPETNHGFITDVAIKRKVRNFAAMAYGEEIYIQSKAALNTLYCSTMSKMGFRFPRITVEDKELFGWLLDEASSVFEVCQETKKVGYTHEFKNVKDIMTKMSDEGLEIPGNIKDKFDQLVKDFIAAKKNIKQPNRKERDEIKDAMVRRYYDIRMFGAVLTAGTNAGQVRGPVQFTFSRSISPVLPLDVSITRIAITKESDHRIKRTEMGRKAIIPYGLYRMHGFFNPKLAANLTAEGNPVCEKDLQILWEALQNMFEYDRSAARGEMVCRGLYVFSHKDEKGLGNAPAHKLFDLIRVKEKDPSQAARSFADYDVNIDFEQDLWKEKLELTKFN